MAGRQAAHYEAKIRQAISALAGEFFIAHRHVRSLERLLPSRAVSIGADAGGDMVDERDDRADFFNRVFGVLAETPGAPMLIFRPLRYHRSGLAALIQPKVTMGSRATSAGLAKCKNSRREMRCTKPPKVGLIRIICPSN